MPILSGGPLYKDRSKGIEDYQSSLGETAAAAFDRALDTGVTDLFARGQEALIGQAAAVADPAVDALSVLYSVAFTDFPPSTPSMSLPKLGSCPSTPECLM